MYERLRILSGSYTLTFRHDTESLIACPFATKHGYEVDGTFAEYVVSTVICLVLNPTSSFVQVSYVDYVTPLPEGVDSAEATPVLCAVCLLLSSRIELLINNYHLGFDGIQSSPSL